MAYVDDMVTLIDHRGVRSRKERRHGVHPDDRRMMCRADQATAHPCEGGRRHRAGALSPGRLSRGALMDVRLRPFTCRVQPVTDRATSPTSASESTPGQPPARPVRGRSHT
jgi:hypothetical protein